MMLGRILCVDDEQGVLDGLRRNLRREFEVVTALGGAEGLKALESAAYDVVMSDYQMPEMSGAQFLGHVRKRWPETTRVLLTGNADLDAAIATVNEGHVYRFLLKPCPKEVLIPALESAINFHNLVVAERVLLQDTLHGAVRMLTDALSLVSPEGFGHCGGVAQRASQVAETVGIAEPWKVEMATLLAQVTLVTLPEETLEKLRNGDDLSSDEQSMIERLPSVGRDLLSPLPRIEDVCKLVEEQGPPWGADAKPNPKRSLGAAVLRACVDVELLTSQGVPFVAAIQSMRQRAGWYPEKVLAALEANPPSGEKDVREVEVADVISGMILLDPVETVDGRLLVAAGSKITPATIERIRNFRANTRLKEPIRVTG